MYVLINKATIQTEYYKNHIRVWKQVSFDLDKEGMVKLTFEYYLTQNINDYMYSEETFGDLETLNKKLKLLVEKTIQKHLTN